MEKGPALKFACRHWLLSTSSNSIGIGSRAVIHAISKLLRRFKHYFRWINSKAGYERNEGYRVRPVWVSWSVPFKNKKNLSLASFRSYSNWRFFFVDMNYEFGYDAPLTYACGVVCVWSFHFGFILSVISILAPLGHWTYNFYFS